SSPYNPAMNVNAPTGMSAAQSGAQGAARPGPSRSQTPYVLPTTAPTGITPPAPVVPAGMLEPVIPGSLPRLYDQTESTTDVSHVEVIQPAVIEAQAVGSKSRVAQRGQELRPAAPGEGERKGPQGTR